MTTSSYPLSVLSSRAEDIPVIWLEPEAGPQPRRLAIWLPYFTGSKEAMQPNLEDLARAGFVALSFDP